MTSPAELFTLNAKYLKGTGIIHKAKYSDGSLALVFHTEEGPEVLTVNLGVYGLIPAEGEVYVREYEQHEGVPEEVERVGIAKTISTVTFGPFDTTARLMRVLV